MLKAVSNETPTQKRSHLSSIKPYNRPLFIRDMPVVKQPKEEVSIHLWVDLNMPVKPN